MDIPFIPAHSSNYARGRTAPILWIVVHYTEMCIRDRAWAV